MGKANREPGTGYAMFNREGVENLIIREFKPHVHGKRQKSDSSWEFLKIENERLKTAQNNSYGQKIAGKLLIYE